MYKRCKELLEELESEGKIKVWWEFKFPEKEELKLRLKDMLEENVDEKYYLSDAQIERIKVATYNVDKTRIQEKEYCDTLCARDFKDSKCIQVGELDIKGQDSIKRVYSDDGCSPTLTNMQGGNRQPKIMIKNATKQGYIEAEEGDSVNLAHPTSNTRRGRVGKEVSQTLTANDSMGIVIKNKRLQTLIDKTKFQEGKVLNLDLYNQKTSEISQTLTEPHHNSQRLFDGLRIRKLTPLECWRLQGFDDEDYYRAKERLNKVFYRGKDKSNSQLYKQAGNSITVNVLEKIFKNLFKGE